MRTQSAKAIAVTQAPMTMLVSVSAWGMGSTKYMPLVSSPKVYMGAVPPSLKPMETIMRFSP